ncbi:MAG: hypothetical protein WBY44_01950, partial [Bryobacteraceae bacterium]
MRAALKEGDASGYLRRMEKARHIAFFSRGTGRHSLLHASRETRVRRYLKLPRPPQWMLFPQCRA